MKLVLTLRDPDPAALFDAELRSTLAQAGVTRLQVNLDDDEVPSRALRLHHLAEPVTCVVSVWTTGKAEDVVATLRSCSPEVAGWQVDERVPLTPPDAPDGERQPTLAQVALLRRPEELDVETWRGHWHGPHTEIAIETQATFGYVQNLVLAPLTDHTPHVDAIVEELFPPEAADDLHAFYGSGGDKAELKRRMTRLMDSVAVMGADQSIDVIPTSRYSFEIGV